MSHLEVRGSNVDQVARRDARVEVAGDDAGEARNVVEDGLLRQDVVVEEHPTLSVDDRHASQGAATVLVHVFFAILSDDAVFVFDDDELRRARLAVRSS